MLGLSSGCSSPEAELPAAYRTVAVPLARLADREARARGRTLYLAHCALCHGERADGRGERRSALARHPVDFTSHAWRARTSPRRAYWALREGLPGTAMPGWKGALSEDQSWDLVAYLLSVAQRSP